MKTVLTKFLALGSLALLMLPACKKNESLVYSNGGKPGALTATATTLVLDKTKLTDSTTVINFSFTPPNYGFSAAVTNTLQIDVPSDNWATPTSVTLGTKVYSQGYPTAVFNNLLLKLNLPAGTASPVVARIMTSVSASVAPIYSNVLSLTVTPFNLTSYLYVPGAYEGWSNPGPQEDSLVSVTGNGVYVGIINFTAGNNQFLITPVKGWANKYATNSSASPGSTTASYPVTYNGSNNFTAPTTAGQYLVTLNINSNTISIVPADYYSIIGSAPPGTAWNTDTPMKYINDGSGSWAAYNIPMVVGEYKFRQDDQWSNSWGPTATAGTITDQNPIGDGNIQLPTAGNYNLTFTMSATTYGTTPSVTTTYTAVKQ